MHKAWRVVSAIALICLVVGAAGIGVGFFTGSSPVVIQNHGSLTEYMERLSINSDIFRESLRTFLAGFGFYF